MKNLLAFRSHAILLSCKSKELLNYRLGRTLLSIAHFLSLPINNVHLEQELEIKLRGNQGGFNLNHNLNWKNDFLTI